MKAGEGGQLPFLPRRWVMKSREVIVKGNLAQFLGLVEFEQRRADVVCRGNDDGSNSRVTTPYRLYGPIASGSAEKRHSLYWLVVNGYYSWFLDAYSRGEPMMTGGPLGDLKLRPGITLEELDRDAQKQRSTLSKIIGTGEMWVSELPNERLRLVFNASRSERPGSFWEWVNDFVAEMERQGFGQPSTDSQPGKKSRRNRRLLAVALALIGGCIAVVTNFATEVVPDFLRPYLWLSWPSLVVLILISLVLAHYSIEGSPGVSE